MSVSTKIITFDQMREAVVYSASSTASGFVADNLVVPMPNCYWKSNAADTQHQIILNLGMPKYSNVLVLITAEEEDADTLTGIEADVAYGNTAAGTFTSVSNPVDPGITDGVQIKLCRYDLPSYPNQFWRITLVGYDSPDYYPPDATKLYGAWIGREYTVEVPHGWPVTEKPEYELAPATLGYAMRHNRPVPDASVTERQRQYLLTGTDMTTFEDVMTYHAGLPIVIQEGDDDPFLATITKGFVVVRITSDIELGKIAMKTLPVLDWDKDY